MKELLDSEVEREVVQIIWDEARSLGAKRGRQLIERSGLDPADFTSETARVLFERAVESCSRDLAPTFKSKAEQSFVSGDTILNPELLGAHADLLRTMTTKRNVFQFAKELATRAKEETSTSEELLAMACSASRKIPARFSNWSTLTDVMKRVEKHLRDVSDGVKTPSVLTGFDSVDEETGGLPATLVVIAAMPGVGKSAFIATVVRNMALRGQKSAVFSMEDEAEWLGFRLLAHESGIHQFILRNKKLTAHQWGIAGNSFHPVNILGGNVLCDDRQSLTPAEVLYSSRAAIMKRGVSAIFLDNMTAMKWERGPRMDLEIQDFLVQARGLANESGVPFVVLSHVKRREDLDVSDMPRLTDCAETSAFEKLSRLAYGLCRKKKSDTLVLGVLKNTNGKAFSHFELALRPSSALIEAETRKAKQQELPVVMNG